MNGRGIRRFVVVSGLPASGKSTIARRLEGVLRLPVIDKDDVLERLFSEEPFAEEPFAEESFDRDPAPTPDSASLRRHRLSRHADEVMRRRAERSDGAIIVSFWRRSELSTTSGTPTDWLARLDPLTELYCRCDPIVAARRFVARQRHPGHDDPHVVTPRMIARFTALEGLGPLGLGDPVVIDTARPPTDDDLSALAALIRSS